jgi:glyoxylase-like metal-dependent hydrolase (beta-lactamase superfamily II)
MSRKISIAIVAIALMSWAVHSQEAKTVLENASQTLGAGNLKSIQFSGTGFIFAIGQSPNPSAPWPKFNLKSYTRVINYETISSREDLVRTQAENPPRGGGQQPLIGEQRQVMLISGNHAWNMVGDNAAAAPAAFAERLMNIWVSPHGLIKAAIANNAAAKSQSIGSKKITVISFLMQNKFNVNGYINDQNLVERTETWIPNPVLGDMLVETIYSDYRDVGGVKFPGRILQKQGGFPALDLTVTEVQPNAEAKISVPDNVRQGAPPPVRVEATKLADGVWYLTGGSHHSAAVEFKDHVVLIEGPLNEDRSLAVIAEVKRALPNKPIKYLINTHHHFDHSGGIRTYAAEGATIITHQINKPFYERAFRAPRSLAPDKLAQTKKPVKIETLTDKRVLTDGTRTLELHHIQGNTHNEGIIMAYLPKEKILIEADVFTPPPPNTPPPSTPNPFSVNLYDNIQRLKLTVEQIAPLHGRVIALADLQKALGKSP